MKIAKHDLMRNTNTLTVLDYIREFGPTTKRDIQNHTGLSWGAVSNISTDLLEKKVLTEIKSEDLSVGRTPTKLDINSYRNLIIGVDINIAGLNAVIIDLKCRVLRKKRVSIQNNSRDKILDQVILLIKNLLDDSRVQKEQLIGIGVAMQGAVDSVRGVSVFSPFFLEWSNVPIKKILEEEFDIPVSVMHDPNCMALTEQWIGRAQNVNNFLFIRLSTGIGMSIVIDGNIYTGVDGNAGEFGHTIMDSNGPLCSCGNNGCLEMYASKRGILKQVQDTVRTQKNISPLPLVDKDNNANMNLVIAAARHADPTVLGIFENAGTYLGIGIANLVNIFNPDLIVLGGDMLECKELYLKKVIEVVESKSWKNSRVNLVVSRIGASSAAIGAAIFFVQKAFTSQIKIF